MYWNQKSQVLWSNQDGTTKKKSDIPRHSVKKQTNTELSQVWKSYHSSKGNLLRKNVKKQSPQDSQIFTEILVRNSMSSLVLFQIQAVSPAVKLGHAPPVLFTSFPICPVTHSTHSVLSSHVELCPTQNLQAQQFYVLYRLFLLTLDRCSFLTTPNSAFLHSIFFFSVWLFYLSWVLSSHTPCQQQFPTSTGWMYQFLIQNLRSTPNYFWTAVYCSLTLLIHMLINLF